MADGRHGVRRRPSRGAVGITAAVTVMVSVPLAVPILLMNRDAAATRSDPPRADAPAITQPPPPRADVTSGATERLGSSAAPPLGPDLVVVSVRAVPGGPHAGDWVTFAAVVRNVGRDATRPTGTSVTFQIDGDTVSWSAVVDAPIPPGGERAFSSAGDAGHWRATPGQHQLTAWVDDLNRVPESDDRNNTLTALLQIP